MYKDEFSLKNFVVFIGLSCDYSLKQNTVCLFVWFTQNWSKRITHTKKYTNTTLLIYYLSKHEKCVTQYSLLNLTLEDFSNPQLLVRPVQVFFLACWMNTSCPLVQFIEFPHWNKVWSGMWSKPCSPCFWVNKQEIMDTFPSVTNFYLPGFFYDQVLSWQGRTNLENRTDN